MPGEAPVDWLIVGLGNPGAEYDGTRHNVGFEVADALTDRWALPKAKSKYRGLLTEGRTGPGGPRVGILKPMTYMNDAGQSVGPARGALKVDLDHVLVIHDEIDLPFGEILAGALVDVLEERFVGCHGRPRPSALVAGERPLGHVGGPLYQLLHVGLRLAETPEDVGGDEVGIGRGRASDADPDACEIGRPEPLSQ